MLSRHLGGVALVTGAGSGIGKETAVSFAEAGVESIVFADINERSAKEAAEKSQPFAVNPRYRALALFVDVSSEESVQALVEATIQKFGRVDYNVNSAGIGGSLAPLPSLHLSEYDDIIRVNATGVMLCMKHVIKAMSMQSPHSIETRSGVRSLGRGSIVNIASCKSYMVTPNNPAYIASKHAVLGLTKAAALDSAVQGLRINAVAPSWVRGPMMAQALENAPEVKAFINAAVPIGRMAEPEEVGDVAVFLCTPSASYINGTAIVVDAGVTLTVRLG